MFCPKCGKETSNDVKFCSNCGANISAQSVHGSVITTAGSGSLGEKMTFPKSIATCFAKYVDYKGRASRPEFWWSYLFTVLISWASILVDSSQVLSMIINLVMFLPTIAVSSRRLHDTNRSGWWQLICITIIGIIPYVIWLASKGSDQNNQYGDPA